MINKLTLTNFRKHENAEFIFGPGTIVIRGANEAGKSTLYDGIIYCLFGSRVLGIPVDDLVTYEKPVASMKAKCEITLDNTLYTITRSKSGATITGGGVTAQGQAEVTKFVEEKLGIPASVASAIMIAKQKDLVGSIAGSGSISLIEELSNVDLIDQLISNIQSKLPSGNTSHLEALLNQALQVQPPKPVNPDLSVAIESAKFRLDTTMKSVADLEAKLDALDWKAAQDTVQRAAQARQHRTYVEGRLKAAQARRAALVPVPPPTLDEAQLLAEQAAQSEETAKRAAWGKWEAWLKSYKAGTVFSMSRETLLERVELARTTATGINLNLSGLRERKATLLARRIDEPVCQWCLKDLSEVPEVVSKNAEIAAKVAEIDEDIRRQELALTTESPWLTPLVSQALKQDDSVQAFWSTVTSYVSSDTNTVPRQLTWVAGNTFSPQGRDYDGLLRQCRVQLAAYRGYQNNVQAADAAVNELQQEFSACVVIDDSNERSVLNQHEALSGQLVLARQAVSAAEQQYNHAKIALQIAQATYESDRQTYLNEVKRAKEIKDTVDLYNTHNALIRKLREVRPVVARRLWTIVLAAVSNYFSALRQRNSVVTRTDSGFRVDGKPVRDLSGSTQDSLGLATRMALQKTFLPNINFIMLDEPGAGMDDDREITMFGTLATAGYAQVMVVTHSDVADAFATNVVQI